MRTKIWIACIFLKVLFDLIIVLYTFSSVSVSLCESCIRHLHFICPAFAQPEIRASATSETACRMCRRAGKEEVTPKPKRSSLRNRKHVCPAWVTTIREFGISIVLTLSRTHVAINKHFESLNLRYL